MLKNYSLFIIIFAPLAGAAINWLIGRRARNERFVSVVACGAIAVSTVVAFLDAFGEHGALHSSQPILQHLWTWIHVGGFRADFALAMDRLSGIYVCFVTFVGLLIHVFATGYMHGDSGFYRFFAYMNLFMFAMLTLVLADNFLLMFVGWEGVGLCSYLLIGYYTDKKEAGDAAKKAFIMNRIGDWGAILGILLVFTLTGSISFFAKPEHGVTSALMTIGSMSVESLGWGTLVAGGITSAAILLFIGAIGKSAQIPLFVWLPDAMAGPTPVSALIHAATMVTAGVYMVVRCNAIYTHAPTAMLVVAIIGAATAIFAATIGLGQNDIKKVLAYSTVSQLGYMFLACGVGAFVVAIFHVMTHAFFKALLFLGSGSVIHGMHHEQDMRRMGGLRKYMPITFATMVTGWLAISGIVPFAGFFSKDEILWKTWSTEANHYGKYLWIVGAFTAGLTAIYMTRLMVMTFWGDRRGSAEHADDHAHGHARTPHESPWSMTVPLIVLAVLSTVGGLVGVPYALSGGKIPNYFEEVLEPVVAQKSAHGAEAKPTELQMLSTPPQPHDGAPAIAPIEATGGEYATAAHSPEEISQERWFTVISLGIALFGMTVGGLIYSRNALLQMPAIIANKYYIDEVYETLIINPINFISREGLWKIFDLGVIDGFLHGVGNTVIEIGSLVRQTQFGFVRSYAAIILFGALIVVGYFAYFAYTSIQLMIR